MLYRNGFGIEITHNYGENYFLHVHQGGNEHKIWITQSELYHLKQCLNSFKIKREVEGWNLAELYRYNTEIKVSDVKKCRDLILKDLGEEIKDLRIFSKVKSIINKRLGDLK